MWSAMSLLDEARSSLERGRYDEARALLWLAVERAAAERDAATLEAVYVLLRERAGEGDDWRRLFDRAGQHVVELTGRVPAFPSETAVTAAAATPPRGALLVRALPQLVGLLLALGTILYVAVVIGSLAE
jgi:hypothetical protein